MKKLTLLLIIASGILRGQTVTLGAGAPPTVSSISTTATGSPGASTYCYHIIPNFPIGKAAENVSCIGPNAPDTLTVSNFVTVSWGGLVGATGYDVVRTTTPSAVGSCTSCLLASNQAATSFTDNGSVNPTSYSRGTTPSPVSVTIRLDNLMFSQPEIIFPSYRINVVAVHFPDGTIQVSASGTGSVTHLLGPLAAGQLIVGNGGADITTGDLTGDVNTTGGVNTTIGNNVVTGNKLVASLFSGNGTAFCTVSGTLGSTHVVVFDALGNCIQSSSTIDGSGNYIGVGGVTTGSGGAKAGYSFFGTQTNAATLPNAAGYAGIGVGTGAIGASYGLNLPTTGPNVTNAIMTCPPLSSSFSQCIFPTNILVDPSTGNISTGVGTGVAGFHAFVQGTLPTFPANSFSIVAPTAITTPLAIQPPNANPAANQFMLFPAPTSNLSQWAWTTFSSTNLTDTANLIRNNGVNTGTSAMTLDMSIASLSTNAFRVPVGAGQTATLNGAIDYDSTNNMLHAGQSSADAFVPQFTATPANNDCVNWVVSGSNYKLGTAGAACGSGSGAGLAGSTGVGIVLSGTDFAPLFGQYSTVISTESNSEVAFAKATTISNLQVILGTATSGSQTVAVTLRKNGVDTTVTCTVGNTSTTCTDTTHSVTTVAADLLDWKLILNTSTLTTNVSLGAQIGTAVQTYSGNTTVAASVSGTLTNGHGVKIDASSNIVDSGAPFASPGLAWFSPAFGNSSAMNTVAQNTTRVWGFSLGFNTTTSAISYDVATADNTSNLYDICVYDSTGTLKLNLGATAGTTLFSATGFKSANWTQGSTTLSPGLYVLGLTSSAASPTVALGGINTSSSIQFASAVNATGGGTSGGACNGSITFPTASWVAGQVVNFALH